MNIHLDEKMLNIISISLAQAPVIMQQPGANMYPTVAQPGAMKPGQY